MTDEKKTEIAEVALKLIVLLDDCPAEEEDFISDVIDAVRYNQTIWIRPYLD